ncbi:hypothetical protein C0V75_10460 [Tabrizicola sp. TH137]|uniref:DUF6920 family protein n=1 Tax=Tabrizicola sp. TH137 TaxID=2067452 RepID=UPI000C7C3B41|nr:DUF6544 family protein [Tabrizicola sp. TH137]PLL12377.1 hypothetical protein C0V75_10460 [Tabrizicola sp. TH137]
MVWAKLGVGAVLLLLLIWGGAVALGAWRWSGQVEALLRRMLAEERGLAVRRFDPAALDGLPPPVARYLRKVLPAGGDLPGRVEMAHEGRFNMGEGVDNWKRFTSRQTVTLGRPGFVWDGAVVMAPGLPVRVIDAYVAGEGVLVPAILGLVPLARLEGGGAIAEGELLRWLAEAPWYPGVLLPGNGVQWRAVDDRSAEARLVDGAVEVRLLFRFGADDLVTSIRAEARGRTVAGKMVPTPWEGRWWAYERRDGVMVPMRGEVSWVLPEGTKPYWRGRVTAYRPLPAP